MSGSSPPDASPAGEDGEERRLCAGRRAPPASVPASPATRAGGRRTRTRLRAIVARALGEMVEATENGQPARITKLEATVKQFVNRAASGDQRATQFVFSLYSPTIRTAGAAPADPESLNEGDDLVIADLVRRLSQSSQ